MMRPLEDGALLELWLCERLLGTVFVASRWRRRRRGLLRGALPGSQGCLLSPCSWVHTRGMSQLLRVLYLDAGGRVLRDEGCVFPGGFGRPCWGARQVVELLPEAPGFEAPIDLGQELEFREAEEPTQR